MFLYSFISTVLHPQPAVILEEMFGVSTGYPVYSGTPQLLETTHTHTGLILAMIKPSELSFGASLSVVLPSIHSHQ